VDAINSDYIFLKRYFMFSIEKKKNIGEYLIIIKYNMIYWLNRRTANEYKFELTSFHTYRQILKRKNEK